MWLNDPAEVTVTGPEGMVESVVLLKYTLRKFGPPHFWAALPAQGIEQPVSVDWRMEGA
jgi:hypothetical protein